VANKPKKDDPNKVEERWVLWSDLEAGVNLKAGHPVVLLLGDHHTPADTTTLTPSSATTKAPGPTAPATTTKAPGNDTTQQPPPAATTTAPPSAATTQSVPSGNTTAPPSDATTQSGPSGSTTAPPSDATTQPSASASTTKPPATTTQSGPANTTTSHGDATGSGPPNTTSEPPNPGAPSTTTHPPATTTLHPASTTTAHPASTTTAHPATTTTAHPAATTTAHPANTTTLKKGKRYTLTADHFDTAKAFPKPEAAAFATYKKVCEVVNGDASVQLLILGHTDTQASDSYNLTLSDERAAAVKAFLLNDVESWMPYYSNSDAQKKWGIKEDQYMLKSLPDAKDGSSPNPPQPYYSRDANGVSNADFTAALKKFQADAGEPATGTVNQATRRKLIAAYMSLEGTSVNSSTTIQSKGCGKRNLAVQTPDNTANADNRRTEIYVFFGAVTPDASAWNKADKTTNGPTYAAWKANTDDDSVPA